jgi:hypothetical protein
VRVIRFSWAPCRKTHLFALCLVYAYLFLLCRYYVVLFHDFTMLVRGAEGGACLCQRCSILSFTDFALQLTYLVQLSVGPLDSCGSACVKLVPLGPLTMLYSRKLQTLPSRCRSLARSKQR